MYQKELALLCGISEGYLSQSLSEKRRPSPDLRQRLQQVLGMSDFDRLFIMKWDDDQAAEDALVFDAPAAGTALSQATILIRAPVPDVPSQAGCPG